MKRRAIAGVFLASVVLVSCASAASKPPATSPFLSTRSQYSAIIKSFQGPVTRYKSNMHVLSTKASPSASQVSAVEQPLIAVLSNVETSLGVLRVPPLLASDLHAMIGATARVRTDLRKVVATWPNSAAAMARTSADINSFSAVAAVLRADLGT